MRRALLLPLAFVFVFGFIDLSVPGASAQETHSVHGRVCTLDYDVAYFAPPEHPMCQGGPLEGAQMTLTRDGLLPDSHEATSDEDGFYAFDGLTAGTYTIHAERPGFEPFEATVEVPFDGEYEFPMTGLQVEQRGSVFTASGTPVDAYLTFHHRTTVETKTDGGAFTATIQAGWHEYNVRADGARDHDEYVFLDGSRSLDVRLEDAPQRTATFTGTVRDQDGSPVAGATVEVYQWNDCCYAYETHAHGDEHEDLEDYPEGRGDAMSEPAVAPVPDRYYDDRSQRTTTGSDGSFSVSVYEGWVDVNIWKDGHSRAWDGFEIRDGQTVDRDYTVQKFPDKTARIEGKITGPSGDGLRWARITIENVEFGQYECSTTDARDDDSPGMASAGSTSSDGADVMVSRPYYEPGCAIHIGSDGSFEGMVTPGYSILRVWYDHWQSCHTTHHGDGGSTRTCGADFFPYSETLDLAPDETTRLRIELQERPGPDAVLSGYVVDAETRRAIPHVHISFSNQDSHGWAQAETDGDGSYRVKLRSGPTQVHVWAEGYFQWEGTLDIPAGDRDRPFDIVLTPGQPSYGGHCCYEPYPMAVDYAEDEARDGDDASVRPTAGAAPPSAGQGATVSESSDSGGDGASSGAADFQDLGGGLGPYDAERRSDEIAEAQDAPGAAFIGAAAALAVGLALVRRRY